MKSASNCLITAESNGIWLIGYRQLAQNLTLYRVFLGESSLPDYLKRFILTTSSSNLETNVAIYDPARIMGYKDADHELIERDKGLMGQSRLEGRV